MRAPGPPLHPSGPEGRHLLRDELLHGEYHRHNLVQRLLDWLWRRLEGGVGAASGTSVITTLVTMLVVAMLVVGLFLLLARVRRDRRRRKRSAAVLTDERLSAAELRLRAERALAQGRYAEAVAEAFRALAVREVERGLLVDLPGTTAREVAVSLATSFPPLGDRVRGCADLFDAVRYGDGPATHDDAAGVLALDDELAGQPVRAHAHAGAGLS
jgi:hypothetical protein